MAATGYISGDPAKVDVADVGQIGGPAGPLDGSGLIPTAQIPGGGGGGPSPAGTVTTETSYGGSSSAGSASTYSKGDHTHGTPSLASSAPGNSAVGDAAAVGSATTPARSDHVHGREAFGTPGASALGDTVAAGSAATPARSDHRHSRESLGAVTAQTSYGASSSNGTATTPARSDHTHGTPAQDPGAALRQAMVPSGRTETRSRLDSGITSTTITSGTLYLVPIWLTAGQVVSSITFVTGAAPALAGGTNQWFGLYDNTRVQLATTTNDTSNAWSVQAPKTLNIAQVAAGAASSFTATYTGVHYLGLMIAATTTPTITGGGSPGPLTANASPGLGGSSTGQTTPPAFPFTAAAPSVGGPLAYAFVS